jgi:hypothetical protein
MAERRILRYHLRSGSSSPAFEELPQKYPNYQNSLAVFSKFLQRSQLKPKTGCGV